MISFTCTGWGLSQPFGNSLLTARGIPASGEGDLKTCVAMLIMDCLKAGGSYTEFYAMDFNDDSILMGHDGPGHVTIAEGKPVLRGLGLYHGKRGYGLSVEFKLDPATFMNRWCEHGPTHHVALGVGHQLARIRKLARLLNLELAVVD